MYAFFHIGHWYRYSQWTVDEYFVGRNQRVSDEAAATTVGLQICSLLVSTRVSLTADRIESTNEPRDITEDVSIATPQCYCLLH